MTFGALQHTLEEALSAARDHARALDRMAAERNDAQALTEHFCGRPSDQPS